MADTAEPPDYHGFSNTLSNTLEQDAVAQRRGDTM
jgi:hypothetical protein